MTTFMRKVVFEKNNRFICASMIIIAANAGGAWTPIGDVTTTMLWIKGYISSWAIMHSLFLPSLISIVIPLLYFSFIIKPDHSQDMITGNNQVIHGSKRVLFMGISALILVPIFKAAFDLPPYLSVLFGLGLLWVYSDVIHHREERLNVPRIISKIDFSSILFFLGVLLSVAALETEGILRNLAHLFDQVLPNKNVTISSIGIISAIIDNVPLTAATMGMYNLASFPVNSQIWKLTAYCVGTGGSLLIIGSAAGVVVMGIEKISFFRYLKKVTLIAFLGYICGIMIFAIF
jgi:Na+/H+ antiporter NhaD/arsenite permease-like protein